MASNISTSSLLEAALDYARRGWPVFPCDPRTKRPYLAMDRDEEGKPIKGTGGVTKATTDEDQIRAWWRKWPRAMIGVAVGRAGLIVIDFDPGVYDVIDRKTKQITGQEEWTLEQLKDALAERMEGEMLPDTLTSVTRSGGEHQWFKMPGGEPIGNTGSLPNHIDVRGLGGYVIAPPSHFEGNADDAPGDYRWLIDGDAGRIAECPDALIAIMRAPPPRDTSDDAGPATGAARFVVDLDASTRRYAMHALDSELQELASTPKGGGRHGGRNQGAYWAAYNLGQFVGAGALSETLVKQSLLDVIRGFDPTAYDKHKDAVENGLANGIAKPRDLSAVGAQKARGRESGRSSSSSVYPPAAPPEAYADDFDRPGPRDEEDSEASFHIGTAAIPALPGGVGDRIAPEANPDMDRRCAFFSLTDLGNAERFRARHGWRFRFCNELGWFVWDGRRWELLSEEKDKVPGKVSLAVFDTVRAIRNEADLVEASGLREDVPADASDDERSAALDHIVGWRGSGDNKVPVFYSETLRAHAKSSEGASRLGCIAGLVKSFDDVAIRADAMDADRMAINVLNGTLRIVAKPGGNEPVIQRFDHNPADLISKIANVVYDPAAPCEAFDGFLSTVQPDEATRRFLGQWHGLSLTGDISEQKLAFYHGKGRNGKSTMVDACSEVAGDYGGSVAIETFLDQGRGRKGGEATPDLARLPGIRFLRTSEPEKGAKLAEALIKLITGGELIDARHLNKGFFSFLPSFKVTISGNHKPKITGHDDGIWRRVMLVPWDVQIAKEDIDRQLPEKLRKEKSGILNWMLKGLIDWRMNGLIEPESVLAATAKYREQSDQLGRFLDECTRPVEGARSKSSVLFALFTAWAKATGAGEWQPQGFSKAMEDRGFEKKTSNGVQWLDIEMTKDAGDFADASGDEGGGGYPGYPGPYGDDVPL
ncbi:MULTISPECIES: phage/plasmid primase, P4 family [Sphingomonas]|uniref:phage/plasmid primase, P4 family n=1 Tax=Sphingomonas TaxID=13687 RepID=UPI00254A4B6F|nr:MULTISPECIES: phage/plasmid primase, P4 family [Sphingomonas]MDK8186709.1 phage/plasmid primase, P4 family [Sphingomonas zeae]MDK8216374.1 phage/plasmid primase, P4 family [Sphingomonas sp. UMB7805-LC452B]